MADSLEEGQLQIVQSGMLQFVTMADMLKEGQTFESWKELRKCIVDHGVQEERVIVTVHKDKKRYMGRCRMHNAPGGGCQWYVRAIVKARTDTITITRMNSYHSCEKVDYYKRRMHTHTDRLADKIFDVIMENRQVKTSFLRDTLQSFVHPDIRYHSAHAAKKRCLTRLDGDEADSFHLIPAHCEQILSRDPGAIAQWQARDGHFSNLFVCPSASRGTYMHCRPIIAFDGVQTMSAFPQILLLATAWDANNTTFLLAYCIAPTENTEDWLWFLENLRDAIPKLELPNTLFLSDKEKELLPAVEKVFSQGHHTHCTWHMGESIQLRFGKEIRKMFDSLLHAVTPEQFEKRMERLKTTNPEAKLYLCSTADPKHYSQAFLPVRRWGHESSQEVKNISLALKPQRMEVALKCSYGIWDYMMTQYFEKKELAGKTETPFPSNIMKVLNDTKDKASHLTADSSNDSVVWIIDEEERQFFVHLEPSWKCSCGNFQDRLLPCVHAWRALTILEKQHFDFVSPFYATAAFCSSYSGDFPYLSRDLLKKSPSCGPPLTRRKRGRPSEKPARTHANNAARRPRKCGTCKLRGHDKRTCPQLPTQERICGLEKMLMIDVQAGGDRTDDSDCAHDEDGSGISSVISEDEGMSKSLVLHVNSSQVSTSVGYFSQLLADMETQCSSPTKLW